LTPAFISDADFADIADAADATLFDMLRLMMLYFFFIAICHMSGRRYAAAAFSLRSISSGAKSAIAMPLCCYATRHYAMLLTLRCCRARIAQLSLFDAPCLR